MYLIWDFYLEYMKNAYNSLIKRQIKTQLKNKLRI